MKNYHCECVIKSNITIQKILSMFCLSVNNQEITTGHLNIPYPRRTMIRDLNNQTAKQSTKTESAHE